MHWKYCYNLSEQSVLFLLLHHHTIYISFLCFLFFTWDRLFTNLVLNIDSVKSDSCLWKYQSSTTHKFHYIICVKTLLTKTLFNQSFHEKIVALDYEFCGRITFYSLDTLYRLLCINNSDKLPQQAMSVKPIQRSSKIKIHS